MIREKLFWFFMLHLYITSNLAVKCLISIEFRDLNVKTI